MLDPQYLLRVSEGSENIAPDIHEAVIKVVVARIMARLGRGDDYRLTAADKWQLEVLQDAGYLRDDLERVIAEYTGLMEAEIFSAFEDAAVRTIMWDNAVYEATGLTPLPFKQSPYLQRLMMRGYEKTVGQWKNFTGTLADAAQQLFVRECDKAYHLVASGAMSYTQAVRQAVETIVADGVVVTYPSGHKDTIETATLRAVRTGVGQACAEITLARMDEMDWDIVLVSAHLGARTGDGGENHTNHFWLQGKFYSRSGRDKRFLPLTICGIGYVDGLLGANCRHSIGPGDGIHNPFEHFDSEENRKREELDKRQRLLERRIRKTRREVMGLKTAMDNAPDEATRAEMELAYQKKARLLQKQEKAYDDFCKENDLKKLHDRLAVAKYGPKEAKAAEEAAGVSAENAALRNRSRDEEQFERYREAMGDEAPKDLATFQEIKYNDPEQWGNLKEFYRYKRANPQSSRRYFDAQQELAKEGIEKGTLLPVELKRAYILPEGRRDPWHITKRMVERYVTDDALREYMENARAMFAQWGGTRRLYVSDEGMCVIAYRAKKDDWVFKTAWTKYDYEADSERIMEVIRKYGI